jgi:ATP-dependent DNA helicase RecG
MARKKKVSPEQGLSLIEAACEAYGVQKLGELLFVTPKRYEDLSHVEESGSLRSAIGRKVVLRVRVTREAVETSALPRRFRVGLTDGRFDLELEEFGSIQNHPLGRLRVGDERLLYGELMDRGVFLLTGAKDVTNDERIVAPTYRGVRGRVSATQFAEIIGAAIGDVEAAVEKVLAAFPGHSEAALLGVVERGARARFESLRELFYQLHRPSSLARAESARQAAKTLNLFEVMEKARIAHCRAECPESVINIPGSFVADLSRMLPFPLTEGQKTVIREIWRDLKSPYPMRRVLSGEVGSGKSTPMGLLAAATHLVGKRVILLFPNSLLASQVASDIVKWFPQVKLRMVTADEKPPIEEVRAENAILAGTTALLTYAEKHGLGSDLCIVDEQQKMSAAQREALAGAATNYLEATATCLPRTAALIAYGGLSCSILREQPVKKQISTHLVVPARANAMMRMIRKAIAAGGKVAVVMPAVEPGKGAETADARERVRLERRSVTTAVEVFERAFPGRVVSMHGRMKAKDKHNALERIKSGDADVVLATSLIEVGITVPRLFVVVVIDPQNMGLSTLHQIRGRLVRDGGRGMFFLYPTSPLSTDAQRRLKVLETCSDGFELAEADLRARGFGDLGAESEEQSGTGSVLFRGIDVFPDDVERMLGEKQAPEQPELFERRAA